MNICVNTTKLRFRKTKSQIKVKCNFIFIQVFNNVSFNIVTENLYKNILILEHFSELANQQSLNNFSEKKIEHKCAPLFIYSLFDKMGFYKLYMSNKNLENLKLKKSLDF